VTEFGADPGNLRMLTYVPEALPDAAPLVVVLHGCKQTAAGYDAGAGWSVLADRFGFALLLPEQRPANNANSCFNWFLPEDTTRGSGEAASIRAMVEQMIVTHRLDRRRVFVTGLSAGGAMTNVMLATYPDVFAGGAIIAGLPYGVARNVQEAFEAMFQQADRSGGDLGALIRRASRHRGPWPRVSIWHGDADATVIPANADALEKQWTDVHGVPLQAGESDVVDGYPRRVWRDAQGRAVVESYTITGMAHGTPIAAGHAEHALGEAMPFILEAGISSSYRIAQFWGLAEPSPGRATQPRTTAAATEPRATAAAPQSDGPLQEPEAAAALRERPPQPGSAGRRPTSRVLPVDPQKVIQNALRAAGLLKS